MIGKSKKDLEQSVNDGTLEKKQKRKDKVLHKKTEKKSDKKEDKKLEKGINKKEDKKSEKKVKKIIDKKFENEKDKEKDKKVRRKLQINFGIVAVVLIILFSFAITPVTLQNDTFYTIKVGESISKYGVDMKDHFSWHEDFPYTYPHWLYDLITYYIYSVFGMTGIYVCTCMLSVILGLTIYFVNSKLTKNQVVSFIITIATMYILKPYIAARAQLVTFILFAFTIYFIEQFLNTKKKRYALGLLIIPLSIANLHVAVWPFYFVLFLPYIAEYLLEILAEIVFYQKIKVKMLKIRIDILMDLGKTEKAEKLKLELKQLEEKIDRVKIKRTKELQNPYKIKITKNPAVKWLIVIMIIAAFTGLLTPLGDTPYTYLSKTMKGNTTQNINEHLPTVLSNETEIICIFILFLAILMFTKIKIRLSDLFMLGGLSYLMLTSRRQVTMLVIIGSVILVRLITEFMESYDKGVTERMKNVASRWISVIIMVIIVSALSYYHIKEKSDDEYIDEKSYPVQACDYILENIDLGKAKFYNEYNYGSYMIFRGIPVFIDSRADLYAPEFNGAKADIFMTFMNTSTISTYYEDTFDKFDITHVICEKNSKVNMLIEKSNDEDYKELYKDDYFVIYERVNV